MSDIQVHSTNQVDQWSKKFHVEYVRANKFNPAMGKDENSAIQLYEDLTQEEGDDLTITLVLELSGEGQTGDNQLEGNEEALINYGCKLTVDQVRNAVRIGKHEKRKSMIDMLNAAKVPLKNWAASKLRDDIITVLYSPNVDGVTAYASCTETHKDTWVAANDDRVLFGAAVSNYSTGDHSASLLNVDSTSDTLSKAIVELAKRRAKLADPKIRPIRIEKQGGGMEEFFIMYCNSLCFRDLRNDSNVISDHQNALERGRSNPLFSGGDIWIDGVICKEIEEIGVISGVGASSIDVAANFLVGAQAVGIAWAEYTHPIEQDSDYGNRMGRGVAETREVKKMTWNNVQHGVFTVYCAAVADT